MTIDEERNMMISLRKAILFVFAIYSIAELSKLLILKEILIIPVIPMILFFTISSFLIFPICFINHRTLQKYPIENLTSISLFIIYWSYNFFFSSVFIAVKEMSDIHFTLSLIMLAFLVLGLLIGSFFTKKRDLNLLKDSIIIRDNEIELRKFNPFSELSLDKAPWLRKPLEALRYAFVIVILFVGGSAAGLSIAIVEVFKRTGVLGDEIDTHAFLFFDLGTPIGMGFGIVIASLISYLYRWRKMVKEIKRKYGSYVVLRNLDNKSYSKLKSEIESGH